MQLPVGCSKRSYAYGCNGRMITNGKYRNENSNAEYGFGDVIGVRIHLLACKPDFMRKMAIDK